MKYLEDDVLLSQRKRFLGQRFLLLELADLQQVQHVLVGVVDDGASALIFPPSQLHSPEPPSHRRVVKHGEINILQGPGEIVGGGAASNSFKQSTGKTQGDWQLPTGPHYRHPGFDCGRHLRGQTTGDKECDRPTDHIVCLGLKCLHNFFFRKLNILLKNIIWTRFINFVPILHPSS